MDGGRVGLLWTRAPCAAAQPAPQGHVTIPLRSSLCWRPQLSLVNPRGLGEQKFIISQFWKLEVLNQRVAGPSLPCPSFWGWPSTRGSPWRSKTGPHGRRVAWPPSVIVPQCVHRSLLLSGMKAALGDPERCPWVPATHEVNRGQQETSSHTARGVRHVQSLLLRGPVPSPALS